MIITNIMTDYNYYQFLLDVIKSTVYITDVIVYLEYFCAGCLDTYKLNNFLNSIDLTCYVKNGARGP